MATTRTLGWQGRLVTYLASAARRPFDEAGHDCALFTAGAVLAMTGVDHAAGWRGTYASTTAGLRALKAAGHEDHVALVASLYEEVPPAFADAGDIGVVELGNWPLLGIVQGEGVYVVTEEGLGVVSRLLLKRAFRT